MINSIIHIPVLPYRHIVMTGPGVVIEGQAGLYCARLIRTAHIAAFAVCPRTSDLSLEAVLDKARRCPWGRPSDIYKALVMPVVAAVEMAGCKG
jgi:hypothetical protein